MAATAMPIRAAAPRQMHGNGVSGGAVTDTRKMSGTQPEMTGVGAGPQCKDGGEKEAQGQKGRDHGIPGTYNNSASATCQTVQEMTRKGTK